MKTLNDYMEMPYRMEIIEDKEEGGFVAFYPDWIEAMMEEEH